MHILQVSVKVEYTFFTFGALEWLSCSLFTFNSFSYIICSQTSVKKSKVRHKSFKGTQVIISRYVI